MCQRDAQELSLCFCVRLTLTLPSDDRKPEVAFCTLLRATAGASCSRSCRISTYSESRVNTDNRSYATQHRDRVCTKPKQLPRFPFRFCEPSPPLMVCFQHERSRGC